MLYLIQHGEAKDKSEDPERDLSELGVAHATQAGQQLASYRVRPARIWHSGKLRAEHTARIIAEAAECADRLSSHAGLNPGDDPTPIAAELGEVEDELMIVGHLPFLERLAGLLIAGAGAPVRFRNCGIVALSRGESRWVVEWAIPPALFSKEP